MVLGAALIAIVVLVQVGGWYARNRPPEPPPRAPRPPHVPATAPRQSTLPRRKVIQAVAILVALLFSKNVYSASLGSYYTFYLMEKFHLPVQTAQLYLFAFSSASWPAPLQAERSGTAWDASPSCGSRSWELCPSR